MNTSAPILEQFEATGSHFEVGLAIGKRFAVQIERLFNTYTFFRQELLPYHHTPQGQARYRQFLKINQARYPDYIAELEGLAQGAGRSFEELFLLNLRGEYRDYIYQLDASGCSDCCLVTDKTALIGHNEDGDPEFRENMYVVHVRVDDKPAFTALCYPGFLCGNALGFNSNGVYFSVNNVRPLNNKPGLGRHFVARSLLDAASLDDALKRATVPGQSSGFNYNIASTSERRVVCVEAAPNIHAVTEVEGAYFHANHYQNLAHIEQVIGQSSQSRLDTWLTTWQKNPPKDASGVLEILGNQSNKTCPIYRTAVSPDFLETFYTALFDLDKRRLRIYTAHPVKSPRQFVEFICQ